MTTWLVAQTRILRAVARPRDLSVPVAGLVVLLAGMLAGLPGDVVAAVGVGFVAVWATGRLWRVALRLHRTVGMSACPGAGLVGLGALAAALTLALPASGLVHLRHDTMSVKMALGMDLATVLFAAGALMLPGVATSVPTRFRRAFDGLGLAVSLTFAVWLVLPANQTSIVSLVSALCAAAGVSIVVVTALRARWYRPSALRCGAGIVTIIVGIWTQVVLWFHGQTGADLALGALPILAGLAVTVPAATRMEPVPDPPREPEHLSGYPLLALPAGLSVIAAIYHVATVGTFDPTSIALGISLVGMLILRELLAVTDIREYARRLASQEAHFRALVSGAGDLTLVIDDRLTVRWQSPAAARLFGLADTEVVGRPFADLIHPDDAAPVTAVLTGALSGEQRVAPAALVAARLRDGFGVWRDTESTISDQRAVPEVGALVVHVRDVGERKHLERTLHRLSYTDQLTGLANQRALMRDVAERQQAGRPGALLVIDLHGVAQVNEAYGREVGDAVLVEVGVRLRALLSGFDVAARLGGDEFAVLTADGAVQAYALGTRVVTSLTEPYAVPGTVVPLHVSVGMAELSSAAGVDELLRHADQARRRAQQLGRDRVEWYDTDLEVQLERRMDLEREMAGAAARGELDLVYQPILDLRDHRPVAVEALLRWRHPQLGTIMPAELLPIARAVGVEQEIGDWVLDTACGQLSAWSADEPDLSLSVNVTPRELLSATFPQRVSARLERHHIAPERLVVEVADSWVSEDLPAVVSALAGVRKLGVRAALDDFGVGQASLAHLRRLPVDMLKLDRSLVTVPAERNVGGQAIIDVVVSLGRRLGLEIVAEGLETAEHIAMARHAGCPYGQGFGLSRPAPAERVEAYLEEHRAARP